MRTYIWKTVFTHWSGEEHGDTTMGAATKMMWSGQTHVHAEQVSKVKCSHVSFSDHVLKRYKLQLELEKGKLEPDQFVNESSKSTRGKIWRRRKDNSIGVL